MEGGSVSRDGLSVTLDTTGEANVLATKTPPTISAGLIQRAMKGVREALNPTNKTAQDVEAMVTT